MHKNTNIRRKLYSLASIIGTTYIIFHIILFIFAKDIQTKWHNYEHDIKEKNVLVFKIVSDFGFNGMIHHYKDYIITKEPHYLEAFNQKIEEFLEHKQTYLKFKNITKLEEKQLEILEQTIHLYQNNLQNNDFTTRIDNSPAIEALNTLDAFFEKKRLDTSAKIDTTIFYVYFFSLIVVLSILLFTLYFKRFLEDTVIEPLIKIEKGLISFFKFLHNKKYTIDPIIINTHDEFGIMAKSINKNIELTSKLHHELTSKNEEFESLIQSY
ncbi:MAG: hypothetical protein WC141_05775, partial [Arcobacteraceae bacterium]